MRKDTLCGPSKHSYCSTLVTTNTLEYFPLNATRSPIFFTLCLLVGVPITKTSTRSWNKLEILRQKALVFCTDIYHSTILQTLTIMDVK